MTVGPGLHDDLPVGRRMAYWRTQRRMSQQVFADRLGKSKSWVDKIERGVRRLDKMSVLREIADVLRIGLPQLVGAAITVDDTIESPLNVEPVRATLTRYEIGVVTPPPDVPRLDQLDGAVAHAWMALARADYERLLHTLPNLLRAAEWARARHHGGPAATLLGQAYQITAELLIRIGERDLARLAADRAMAAGADVPDALWAARAVVPLAAVVREAGRARPAFEVCIATADRVAGPGLLDGPPGRLSVYGTLLLQAALTAARMADRATIDELLDQSGAIATRVGPGQDHYWTGFGPGLVAVTRVATRVELGRGGDVLDLAEATATDPDQQRLPAAVRAAHLVDVARAHLQAGDPVAAGRVILEAEQTAAAEVRHRPAVREVLGTILRQSRQPDPAVVRLAEDLGATV